MLGYFPAFFSFREIATSLSNSRAFLSAPDLGATISYITGLSINTTGTRERYRSIRAESSQRCAPAGPSATASGSSNYGAKTSSGELVTVKFRSLLSSPSKPGQRRKRYRRGMNCWETPKPILIDGQRIRRTSRRCESKSTILSTLWLTVKSKNIAFREAYPRTIRFSWLKWFIRWFVTRVSNLSFFPVNFTAVATTITDCVLYSLEFSLSISYLTINHLFYSSRFYIRKDCY